MIHTPEQRCENCHFSRDFGHQCRRHAPVAPLGTTAYPKGAWPIVGTWDWCGDWQPVVKAPERPPLDHPDG